MKIFKASSVFALIVMLALMSTMPALAADTPLSEIYFYNHGEVGGLSTLDTTTYKSQTEAEIDSAGYDCKSYTNVAAGPKSSSSVIRTLGNDAVFHINCHAGPGRMATVKNNTITRLSAKAVSDDSVYSLAYNFDNTTNKLKNIRLAYWSGCNTYGTSSTYGSLNEKSINLGVDAAVTHTDNTYASRSTYFAYLFFWYLNRDSATVSAALASAKAYALAQFNNDDYITKTVKTNVAGSSSTKIKPAAYGS